MNSLTTAVSEANQWWESEGHNISQEIQNLNAEQSDVEQSIRKIENTKTGINPIKFLAKKFNSATQLPKLNSDLLNIIEEKDDLTTYLSESIEIHTGALISRIATTHPETAQKALFASEQQDAAKKELDSLEAIQEKTQDLLDAIAVAWKEADEAHGWENGDMFTSNAGISLISHFETTEAKDHLKIVGKKLEEYKNLMSDMQAQNPNIQLTSKRAEDIGNVAQWDLIAGLLDFNVVSILTSWENRKQLIKAKEKLENISEAIKPVLSQLEANISEAQEKYDCAQKEYLDIRYQALNNIGLPQGLVTHLQQGTTEDHQNKATINFSM